MLLPADTIAHFQAKGTCSTAGSAACRGSWLVAAVKEVGPAKLVIEALQQFRHMWIYIYTYMQTYTHTHIHICLSTLLLAVQSHSSMWEFQVFQFDIVDALPFAQPSRLLPLIFKPPFEATNQSQPPKLRNVGCADKLVQSFCACVSAGVWLVAAVVMW